MAAKKTSNPKDFDEFDKTLGAVIKPGAETVHYLMTLDGVNVPAASRTASLADAPEVIEGLIATLEENYARFLTEEAAKASKKTKRSSKKPAAKKKPAAAKPAPKEEQAPEADVEESEETDKPEEETSADKAAESTEAEEEATEENDEAEEQTPTEDNEQLSMLDGIEI